MFTDPAALGHRLLDDLQTLAAYLQDESSDPVQGPRELTAHARQCKEALLTITVLMPKLRALTRSQEAVSRAAGNCIHCD